MLIIRTEIMKTKNERKIQKKTIEKNRQSVSKTVKDADDQRRDNKNNR